MMRPTGPRSGDLTKIVSPRRLKALWLFQIAFHGALAVALAVLWRSGVSGMLVLGAATLLLGLFLRRVQELVPHDDNEYLRWIGRVCWVAGLALLMVAGFA
jgi:4-hydroxybenzoate polyprenyltransferase